MRAARLLAASGFAALALSACTNTDATGGHADARVCTPFPEAANANANGPAAPVPAAADPAAALDDCLHRWGYALAGSTDAAEAVAQATVAACVPALTHWNQQGLSAGQPGADSAPSLLTGQPTNPLTEHYTYAQARALFYVVQARAGKCAAPANLTPAGTR
jgi:hypothetical protein